MDEFSFYDYGIYPLGAAIINQYSSQVSEYIYFNRGVITVPLGFSYFTDDDSRHHFEFGMSITPWFGETIRLRTWSGRDANGNYKSMTTEIGREVGVKIYFPLILAYRYMPYSQGLFFRVGFTPLFAFDFGIKPWFTLSVGFTE